MSPFHQGWQVSGWKQNIFGAGSSLLATAAGASVSGSTPVSVSLKIGGHFAAHKNVDLSWLCWSFM